MTFWHQKTRALLRHECVLISREKKNNVKVGVAKTKSTMQFAKRLNAKMKDLNAHKKKQRWSSESLEFVVFFGSNLFFGFKISYVLIIDSPWRRKIRLRKQSILGSWCHVMIVESSVSVNFRFFSDNREVTSWICKQTFCFIKQNLIQLVDCQI